jgi:hypothetical protein
MPKTRLILAALLIAAPMLSAQQAGTSQAQTRSAEVKTAPDANHARRPSQPTFEPLQLTITFKRTRGDKITTQKTYTIAASSEQSDPQIRDDSRVPIKKDSPAAAAPTEYVNGNTDVDIQSIREVGGLISLTLRISQEGYSDSPERPSANTSLGSHRYTVSPTVPMGKLVTVYSMSDEVNNFKVEVQLLVEPLKVN